MGERKAKSLRKEYQLVRLGKNKINGDETIALRNEAAGFYDDNDHERTFPSKAEAIAYAENNSEWQDVDFTILTVYRCYSY